MNTVYKVVEVKDNKFYSDTMLYLNGSSPSDTWCVEYEMNKKVTAKDNSYLFVFKNLTYAKNRCAIGNEDKPNVILECETEDEVLFVEYEGEQYTKIKGYGIENFWKYIKPGTKKGNRILKFNKAKYKKEQSSLDFFRPHGGTYAVKSLTPKKITTVTMDEWSKELWNIIDKYRSKD